MGGLLPPGIMALPPTTDRLWICRLQKGASWPDPFSAIQKERDAANENARNRVDRTGLMSPPARNGGWYLFIGDASGRLFLPPRCAGFRRPVRLSENTKWVFASLAALSCLAEVLLSKNARTDMSVRVVNPSSEVRPAGKPNREAAGQVAQPAEEAARPVVFRASGEPVVHYTLGSPVTFATHAELAADGFSFGPSDGTFGAIPAGGNSYTFFGTAGSSSSCVGTPKVTGTFAFTGTLDRVTGSNGCRRLFGPGDGPAGWAFDQDYAGGGQVVRFSSGGNSGWLMPFHGEFHWKDAANPPSFECTAGAATSLVPCFYSSLGLAVSTDNGKTFEVVGQILQPSQPLSVFEGGGKNMAVGYGSLLVADANGKHLDNPPADPGGAYFYLFFADLLAGSPGPCALNPCMGVARALYADVVAAALSGDPHKVATVFRKYDGASPNPWTQPATAFVEGNPQPDLSGIAGKYAPLWTNEASPSPEVMYDRSFDVYLAVYVSAGGFKVRASSDLIHWSLPIGPAYSETGRTLFYPTLLGETGDPTIGGPAPRVYFSSFPTGSFPDYTTQIFESVPLMLSSTVIVPSRR